MHAPVFLCLSAQSAVSTTNPISHEYLCQIQQLQEEYRSRGKSGFLLGGKFQSMLIMAHVDCDQDSLNGESPSKVEGSGEEFRASAHIFTTLSPLTQIKRFQSICCALFATSLMTDGLKCSPDSPRCLPTRTVSIPLFLLVARRMSFSL